MRSKTKNTEYGTRRIITKFLFLPKETWEDRNIRIRWLERATWEEEYVRGKFQDFWKFIRYLD